jgi:hypothetical protein
MTEKKFVGSTRETLKANLNDRGWVNIDLKSKKDGGFYAEIPTMDLKGAAATNAQDDDLF